MIKHYNIMRKALLIIAAASIALVAVSCRNRCNCNCGCDKCTCAKSDAAATTAAPAPAEDALAYTIVENPQSDISNLPVDKDGYITIFDGKTLNGWRCYGKDAAGSDWNVDDGAIHLKGSGNGEGGGVNGGDLIFSHKFKNFELTFEYKISKGGNSGVFYLAQEVKNGKGEFIPIWQSASEYQVLDNENHPDAQLGVDGNRQSASLYDMIPAKPQNAKPFGEWNKAKIMVFEGTVIHGQNGQNVVEYHLWTPKWKEMLDNSKFNADGDYPIAYQLLLNMGGENHEGYIGFQDHGDDVWYRNIKVKILK